VGGYVTRKKRATKKKKATRKKKATAKRKKRQLPSLRKQTLLQLLRWKAEKKEKSPSPSN
jgi:hypothetical protein